MTNRIEIRGVIVSSDYDTQWMQQYIDKGILTPESTFRRALASADKGQPLELYINSPGGSVFSAYEMINALTKWRLDNKQPVQIVIGAMAASAASAIAILSGVKVSVHRNSKLMFHGAWTVTIGGAEAHADEADLLNKINDDIKARLVSKYNIAPDTVDSWFAEGRMGWLTAQDAIKYGIASDVIDSESDVIEFADPDVVEIGTHGLAIAAFAKSAETAEDLKALAESEVSLSVKSEDDGEDETKTEDEPGKEDEGKEDEGGKSDTDGTDSGGDSGDDIQTGDGDGEESEETETTEQDIAQRVELVLADRLSEHLAKITELESRVNKLNALQKKTQSERDKATSENEKNIKQFEQQSAEMRTALEKANAQLSKLTAGSLKFSPDITSWEEALKDCGGDYAKAAVKYPALKQNYIDMKSNKGKN